MYFLYCSLKLVSCSDGYKLYKFCCLIADSAPLNGTPGYMLRFGVKCRLLRLVSVLIVRCFAVSLGL